MIFFPFFCVTIIFTLRYNNSRDTTKLTRLSSAFAFIYSNSWAMKIKFIYSESFILLRNSKPSTTSDRGNAQKCFDSSQFQSSTDERSSCAVSKINFFSSLLHMCARRKKSSQYERERKLDNAANFCSTAACEYYEQFL